MKQIFAERISSSASAAALAALLLSPALSAAPASAEGLPDGAFAYSAGPAAPGSPADMRRLNEAVKASKGRLAVDPSGRFSLDGERIRLVGLNRTDIPAKSDAGKTADWMASMGLNAVRFHHIDAPWAASLLPGYGVSTRKLDAGALDRLDFFVAELEKAGILIDMNLLTGRQFSSLDGLPREADAIKDFKALHALGFFYPPALELQKEYARSLLGHLNPYTKKTYAEDPRVAIVEINNENGLVHVWLSGLLDVPEKFLGGLRKEWNASLLARYGSRGGMMDALGMGSPPGKALIEGEAGGAGWNLERHQGAAASLSALKPGGKGEKPGTAVAIDVTGTGREGWHVQYVRSGIALEAGKAYTLSFRARASARRKITADISMSRDPWSRIALGDELLLGPEWKEYALTAPVLERDEPDARINLSGMGLAKGRVEIGEVRLVEGGSALPSGADPAKGTMSIPHPAERASLGMAYQEEFIRFLYGKEAAYWREMRRFLREDLGVGALLCGTIVGCSFPSLMAEFDVVDAHAYWNHPSFPSRDWDTGDYYVSNANLAAEKDGGTLSQLAMRRVEGKPFMVSEYDHPYPNRYAAQMWPMLAAFASFQDWDAIFGFCMEPDGAGPARIRGYFDQNHNPAKAAALPLAARAFRLGLVAPGKEGRYAELDPEAEARQAAGSWAWSLVDGRTAGIPPWEPLAHRVALRLPGIAYREGGAKPAGAEGFPSGGEILSDSGEIRYRPVAGEWSVEAPGFIAASLSGQSLELPGGFKIDGGGGFLAFMALALDGRSLSSLRAILWACGEAGNGGEELRAYGMKAGAGKPFGPEDKLTTRADLGPGPAYALLPAFRAAFPPGGEGRAVYALDGRGMRRTALPSGGGGRLVLSPPEGGGSLWFEIAE
jgi:hypothetical protein